MLGRVGLSVHGGCPYFPHVLCGTLKKIAIECVKLYALCSTFFEIVKIWVFFCFKSIFRQDLVDVQQQTIHHVKEQLISFHMMYDLLQDFFWTTWDLLFFGTNLEKVTIFLLNKKKQTLQNTLKLPQYQQIWQKSGLIPSPCILLQWIRPLHGVQVQN